MPESDEKKELGGVARSIDALFSSADAAPAPDDPDSEAEPTPPESSEAEPTGSEPSEAEPIADERSAASVASEGEPPESSLSFADVEVPEDVVGEATDVEEVPVAGATEEAPAPHAAADAPDEAASTVFEPDSVSGQGADRPSPESEDGTHELLVAVEAFLSGSPDAAEEIDTIASALREKLALDPLADAVERLVRAAGDPPDQAILDLASSIINPAVASRLVQRMGAEHHEERRAEYVVLSQRLGRVMAAAFRGALSDSTDRFARRAYFDALIAMGEGSRAVIEEMVTDENRFLVRNAVSILGEAGGDRAVELVTSALANTDPRVRREALLALAKLGGQEAGQLVIGLLEDSDAGVRLAAAVAVGELKLERALRILVGLLDGEQDPDVCVPLLDALGQLGDPGAVPSIEKHALRPLLSKPRTDIRIAAYRALHRISTPQGTPHAHQLLDKATNDKDVAVRAAVRDLLKGP